MYKILFIDEHQDDIDDFLDYVDNTDTNKVFEVIILLPKKSIGGMINEIIEINPDAIVTDFMLNEYKDKITHNVPYTGVDLVDEIKNIKESFPCFVMTSYDEDAIKIAGDVNIVYIKGILHDEEQKTSAQSNFLERIENQIEHYSQRIELWKNELQDLLIESDQTALTADEEKRLTELDSFLENSVHKGFAIPTQLKEHQRLDDLHKLIKNTDDLIEQLKSKNG